MDQGLITFFDVKYCGFYSTIKKNDPKKIDGSLEETIVSFYEWVKDRDVSETIPWNFEQHPKRTQIYCKSITQDPITKDTLLVLWKRFGDDSGKVSGISPGSKVGQNTGDSIKIEAKIAGKNAILGQPMYYWIVPSKNVIASINFRHSCAATKEVCEYIKRCVDFRIPNARRTIVDIDPAESLVVRELAQRSVKFLASDGKTRVRFKFFVSTKEINSDIADSKKLSKRISHIVMRDTVSTSVVVKDDRNAVFKIWQKINQKKKYSHEIEMIEEVNLTAVEVEDIIKVHGEEYDPKNGWNDIGFREGGTTTRWFSSYISKEHLSVEPLEKNMTYYSADKLYSKLITRRDDLLQQVILNSSTDEIPKKTTMRAANEY